MLFIGSALFTFSLYHFRTGKTMSNCLCGFDAAVDLSGAGVCKGRKKAARVELMGSGMLCITFMVGATRERQFHAQNVAQLPHQVNDMGSSYCIIMKDGTNIYISCNVSNQLKQLHAYLTKFMFTPAFGPKETQRSLSQPAQFLDASGPAVDFVHNVLPAEDLVKIPVHWRIPNFETAVANDAVFVTKSIPQDVFSGVELKLTLLELGRTQIHVKLAPVFSDKKSSATALMAGYELAFTSVSGDDTVKRTLWLGPVDAGHCPGCSYPRPEVVRLCSVGGAVVLRGEILLKSSSFSRIALRRMYENGTYSDFSIKVEDKTLKAHKCVLAEVSQEFKKLLDSNELEIKDTTADAVKAMLQFFYGDPLCFKGRRELACAVLELADKKFKVTQLKRVCEDALIELIGRSNVFALASLAVRSKAEFLCSRAFEYICRDLSIFAERSDDWASIKAKHPDAAMAICEFVISEKMQVQGAEPSEIEESSPSAKKAKTSHPDVAMDICESVISEIHVEAAAESIQESSRRAKNAKTISDVLDFVSAIPSNPTQPAKIPVRFILPADFTHLMETSLPGFSLPPLRVSHESLPGISWELIVYPNGKDKADGCIAVFMRAVCTSSKKSQATAPSAGFSLAFQSGDIADALKLPFHLSVLRFCKDDEHGVFLFAAQRRWLTKNCSGERPAAIVGEILVEVAATRQVVRLQKLLESGDESDFVLKADGETFEVHKNILSQSSPTMSAMLRAGFREARNKEMEIGETAAEAVRAMLQFWYGDPLCFDGLEDLSMEVYKLAARYQDDDLRSICENALFKVISRENVVHLTAFAVDQNCERLEKAAFEFLKENARVILKEESWAQFKEANLQLALAVAEKLVHSRRLE